MKSWVTEYTYSNGSEIDCTVPTASYEMMDLHRSPLRYSYQLPSDGLAGASKTCSITTAGKYTEAKRRKVTGMRSGEPVVLVDLDYLWIFDTPGTRGKSIYVVIIYC